MKLIVFNILSPKIQCLQKINEEKYYNVSNNKKKQKNVSFKTQHSKFTKLYKIKEKGTVNKRFLIK